MIIFLYNYISIQYHRNIHVCRRFLHEKKIKELRYTCTRDAHPVERSTGTCIIFIHVQNKRTSFQNFYFFKKSTLVFSEHI